MEIMCPLEQKLIYHLKKNEVRKVKVKVKKVQSKKKAVYKIREVKSKNKSKK
jgi:hypothetical protein